MNRQKSTLVVAVLMLLVGWAPAQAQSRATVSINFNFMAGTTPMPAGRYTIGDEAAAEVSIRDAGGGKAAAVLPVITFLGRHDSDQFPELVFDIDPDGLSHLSEVWFPGRDGYLVLATVGPHKHQVVQSK